MWKPLGLLFLGAWLGGCAAESTPYCAGEYAFHPGYPDELRPAAVEAFAKWSRLTGEPVLVSGEADREECVVRSIAMSSRSYKDSRAWLGHDFIAKYDAETSSISIVPEQMDAWEPCAADHAACALHTLLHELGHSGGLEHTTEPGAMLAPPVELVTDYSEADRAECEKHGHCLHGKPETDDPKAR